ncbi:MAG: PAS domain S-box protein [Armatimonadetes bacterium]|nr:PAS domain S-box protein [Armatimonadota bacterium]
MIIHGFSKTILPEYVRVENGPPSVDPEFSSRVGDAERLAGSRLAILANLEQHLGRSLDLQPILDTGLALVLELMGLTIGWITLLDDEGAFFVAAAKGLPEKLEHDPGSACKRLPCSCEQKLLQGELEAVTNIRDCGRLKRLGRSSRREGSWIPRESMSETLCHACVPLRVPDRALGVLNLVRPDDASLPDEELTLLAIVGETFSEAISRSLRYEKMKDAHRRAHQSTHEAEARYRGLFESVPVGLYRAAPTGRILEANPTVINMLGFPSRESILAMNAADFYANPEDLQSWTEEMEHGDTVRGRELCLKKRDGSLLWVRNSARAARSENGEILWYEGVVEDITERKLMEAELEQTRLREQQEREVSFDAVLHSMAEGVLIVGGDGLVRFANEAASRLLGRPTPSLLHQPVSSAVERKEWQDFIGPIVTGRDRARSAVLAVTLDGEIRYLISRAEAITLSNGSWAGFVCVLTDVTEFREMDQLKSNLIAFVSHELRQPLTAVKGFALTLLQCGGETVTQDHFATDLLSRIDHEADRLIRLVEAFLDISKIDSDRPIDLSPKFFDVREMVDQAVEMQRASAVRCTFSSQVSKEVGELRADRDKMIQVLCNLLSNADKYSPDGGHVIVRVGRDTCCLRFEVADEGIGIPEESMKDLFTPFHRVPNGTTQNIHGTGLGLYLCKHLVEAHGGLIGVESAVGKGTTFIFTIPHEALAEGPDGTTQSGEGVA